MPIRLKGVAPAPGAVDRRSYQIDVQDGYRRVRLSSGTRDKKLALRKEQQVVDALRENPNVTDAELRELIRGRARSLRIAARQVRASSGRTLKSALIDMEDGPWSSLKSLETIKSNAKVLQRFLPGETLVACIDQPVVDSLIGKMRAANLAPATVNRKMQTLLSTLRHEKALGNYVGDLPAYKPTSERQFSRQYVMTVEDEELLMRNLLRWDALPDGHDGGRPRERDAWDYHDLFTFLADVGCRLSQAFKVRWTDIVKDSAGDTTIRFWRLGEQKGGRARTIPATDRVVTLLKRRRGLLGDAAGPFCHLNKMRAAKLWRFAKKGTHLENEKDCVIHSLRHTCATRLLELTGDIRLAQEWLGHTNITTTASIYGHVMSKVKKGAVEKLNALSRRSDIA